MSVLHSVTLALKLDQLALVKQPVKQRCCQGLIVD